MTLWQQISASALVGPERKPFQTLQGEGALAGVLAKLAGDPAEQLLKAAAIVSLHTRAGVAPATPVRDLKPACPPDLRPRCNARAAFHLKAMLSGTMPGLLQEWLATLNASGQRVPEELVPELLHAALRHHRDLVLEACGPLGEWLQMPVPQAPTAAPLNEDWETATGPERVAQLVQLRRTAPQEAVARIQSTWTTDKAEQRRDFLNTLAQGLSTQDEPFLETALDDKSVVVRRAAVDLLAKLPSSALSQRMAEALGARLKFETKGFLLNRKHVLSLDPFTDVNAALVRDGIEKKGAPQGMGERAWWTMQAISLLDPALWSTQFKSTPEDLLKAAANGEDERLFITAWTTATQRHANAGWALALLKAGVLNPPLFRLLTPREQESLALSAKEYEPFIDHCHHAWSAEFTAGVLPLIHEWPPYRTREIARFASVQFVDDIPTGSPGLNEFASVLRFRRDMHQALKASQ